MSTPPPSATTNVVKGTIYDVVRPSFPAVIRPIFDPLRLWWFISYIGTEEERYSLSLSFCSIQIGFFPSISSR